MITSKEKLFRQKKFQFIGSQSFFNEILLFRTVGDPQNKQFSDPKFTVILFQRFWRPKSMFLPPKIWQRPTRAQFHQCSTSSFCTGRLTPVKYKPKTQAQKAARATYICKSCAQNVGEIDPFLEHCSSRPLQDVKVQQLESSFNIKAK